MLVCKFGGTSMSSGEAIQKAAKIIKDNPNRKFVVVSAPGKINGEIKITDLLINCFDTVKAGKNCRDIFAKVKERFEKIINELKLDLNLTSEFDSILKNIEKGASKDYDASRGEYLMAIIFARVLGFDFVDACDIIKFDGEGKFDSELTNDLSAKVLSQKVECGAVIPGFYGQLPNGEIITFSRGGSDVSGSIIARAAQAEVYENWTDVNGFRICDPKIIPDSIPIDILTYQELRELSYMGATVLHPESIFPVRRADIPINIRNTFEPTNLGTMIIPSKYYIASERKHIITGIAGKKDFTAIYIEKSMMNSELGFARKALSILEQYDISFEHMPSGIDTLSLVCESSYITGKLDHVLARLQAALNPDRLEVVENISLIATVGHGMSKRKGTAAKLFNALYKSGINIKMIDQGSSELNIIVGVSNDDFERAIQAIYNAFVIENKSKTKQGA